MSDDSDGIGTFLLTLGAVIVVSSLLGPNKKDAEKRKQEETRERIASEREEAEQELYRQAQEALDAGHSVCRGCLSRGRLTIDPVDCRQCNEHVCCNNGPVYGESNLCFDCYNRDNSD